MVVHFASDFWIPLELSPPSCWQNFLLLFWNVLFSLTLFQYLLSLSSFDNIFWFISSSCVVRFVALLFCSFLHKIYRRVFPSLTLSFLIAFSLPVLVTQFPIQVLYFCSSSFGEHWFYHRFVSLPHKLVHFVKLYCPLGYLFIICLPFQFLPWLFFMREVNVGFF